GLKTAAVGKSGPAFLQDYKRGGVVLDERHVYPASVAAGLQAAGIALPKLTPIAYPDGSVTLGATNGDPTAGKAKATLTDKVTSDPTTATTELNADANTYLMSAYLNYILPTEKPDLSLVWLRSPDSTEHAYGLGTAPFRDALHTQDALLGQLRAKLTALGELDSTNIIVVSDHGHSNVAGDATLFPLRAITGSATGAVEAAAGYSVSGDVRTADLMTRAGFTAYDGNGCVNDPVMSGIKADGTGVYTPKIDADGSICGTAGAPYVTPSYRVPATLGAGTFVIAANGGSDYLYQPEHDPALVARAVKFLQSRQEYGAIFVDDRYSIPGTLPMSRVHLENASGRNPDIVVSFNFDANATVQGFKGTEYESAGNNRGMHGTFGPADVHNTLLASGPNFRTAFTNTAPSGNVDVAPTVAAIFGVSLPRADGRVLTEALAGNEKVTVSTAAATVTPAAPATGLSVARPTDPDGKDVDASQTSYSFDLKTKTVTQAGKTYTYFDSATPVRK
ncbi:alkaline phosphatase family protein, partial [Deinococcus sp.]|uniref:alkaline phosphatase family protein n=1 Tax=Deinococcus sp. TaxID=47478 RepID=UPI002869A605